MSVMGITGHHDEKHGRTRQGEARRFPSRTKSRLQYTIPPIRGVGWNRDVATVRPFSSQWFPITGSLWS